MDEIGILTEAGAVGAVIVLSVVLLWGLRGVVAPLVASVTGLTERGLDAQQRSAAATERIGTATEQIADATQKLEAASQSLKLQIAEGLRGLSRQVGEYAQEELVRDTAAQAQLSAIVRHTTETRSDVKAMQEQVANIARMIEDAREWHAAEGERLVRLEDQLKLVAASVQALSITQAALEPGDGADTMILPAVAIVKEST